VNMVYVESQACMCRLNKTPSLRFEGNKDECVNEHGAGVWACPYSAVNMLMYLVYLVCLLFF
jgi:hypothetical protein